MDGDALETLEIIIDGNAMVGGADSPTLIGPPGEFLPASIHYTLESFVPQEDGRCLARYVRCDAEPADEGSCQH